MHRALRMSVTSALTLSGLDLRTQRALQLMLKFVQRTGLILAEPGRRYLWTDAYAVCNLLSLEKATSEVEYTELAARLVAAVHVTLGKHRSDDWREGWLSGLSDRGASEHPTWGGLRIGKPKPERRWDEAYDEHAEWERDGQYFHYLTKWMHALDQLARTTRQPRYNRWARELMSITWQAFATEPKAGKPTRLVWKMSIDLTRPLVTSMGQHDALDGYVTCVQLQSTAALLGIEDDGPTLAEERAGFESMLETSNWNTTDALGLGTVLTNAWRVGQLHQLEGAEFEENFLPSLLTSALEGLSQFCQQNTLARPASARLPFRELGLAVGLHALERLRRLRLAAPRHLVPRDELELLEALTPVIAMGSQLDAYWLAPEHRDGTSWSEHRDINEVMLATSLCPGGYLDLTPLT